MYMTSWLVEVVCLIFAFLPKGRVIQNRRENAAQSTTQFFLPFSLRACKEKDEGKDDKQ
jgi:hypothetical protein